MEETIRQFSPEQEDKLAVLRAEQKKEKAKREHDMQLQIMNEEWRKRRQLEKGCDCTVTIDGVTIIGTVLDIRTEKYETYFDISTPMGALKNFKCESPNRKISKRKKHDFSNVVIPESLNPLSTQRLLRMLEVARVNGYDTIGKWPNFEKISYDQLKAILATRPHISSTKEKRVIKAYQEKNS